MSTISRVQFRGATMKDPPPASETVAGAEIVVARYRWTVDELRTAYRNHYRYSSSSARIVVIVLGAVGLVGSSVLFFTQSVPEDVAIVPIVFGILLALAWFSRSLTVSRYSARSQFRRRPDQDIELEWRFGSEEIQTQSELGEARFVWSAMIKVVKAPDGLLLYSLPTFFNWIPRHAFASDADFERVAAWATRNITECRSK